MSLKEEFLKEERGWRYKINLMLPRKSLIALKSEFGRIKAGAKLHDSPSFGLLISYGGKGQSATAAFIVSKKIDKRSVVRHEVKRKLSDTTALYIDRLPKAVELVFLAKQKAVTTEKAELVIEVEQVLRRARLLK